MRGSEGTGIDVDKTVEQLRQRHLAAVPFSRYQYVDVTFGSTANLDTVITHDLLPDNPEGVNYEVVRADRACRIYNDESPTRRPWARGYVVLRSDTADATVRLRLTLEPA